MISLELLVELNTSLQNEHDKLVEELASFAKQGKDQKDWTSKFPKFETNENFSSSQREEEADEVEEYEARLATEQSLESRLLEVKRALERIRTRQFGICLKCGKDISLERLKANPAAENHVEHQTE